MYSIQDATLLASKSPSPQKHQLKNLLNVPRTIKKSISIATIRDAAYHPLRTIGEFRDVVEGWSDGLTKDQRDERVQLEAQKALRYMQQRNVSYVL
jgi:hypothetical protein